MHERTEPANDISDDVSWTAFRHEFVEVDGNRVECTIFPRSTDDDEIITHWITATSGSFVSLEDVC